MGCAGSKAGKGVRKDGYSGGMRTFKVKMNSSRGGVDDKSFVELFIENFDGVMANYKELPKEQQDKIREDLNGMADDGDLGDQLCAPDATKETLKMAKGDFKDEDMKKFVEIIKKHTLMEVEADKKE